MGDMIWHRFCLMFGSLVLLTSIFGVLVAASRGSFIGYACEIGMILIALYQISYGWAGIACEECVCTGDDDTEGDGE